MKTIDILFDGPPGPTAGHFVEVEDESGASIGIGEWIDCEDGFWALRIPDHRVLSTEVSELQGDAFKALEALSDGMYDITRELLRRMSIASSSQEPGDG